jgi:hypothetical protein
VLNKTGIKPLLFLPENSLAILREFSGMFWGIAGEFPEDSESNSIFSRYTVNF